MVAEVHALLDAFEHAYLVFSSFEQLSSQIFGTRGLHEQPSVIQRHHEEQQQSGVQDLNRLLCIGRATEETHSNTLSGFR